MAWAGFADVAHAEQSFSSWLMMEWSQRVDYGLEPRLSIENRVADAKPDWQMIEVTPELTWHYSPRYDFSVGYVLDYEDQATGMLGEPAPEDDGMRDMYDGKTVTAHLAMASATVLLPIKDFNLSSRQRIEVGVRQDETAGVFRQLNRVDYMGQFPLRLKPFVSHEWFWDFEEGYLVESRTIIGVGYEIMPHQAVEIFGMRRDVWNRAGYSDAGHIFGVTWMFNF